MMKIMAPSMLFLLTMSPFTLLMIFLTSMLIFMIINISSPCLIKMMSTLMFTDFLSSLLLFLTVLSSFLIMLSSDNFKPMNFLILNIMFLLIITFSTQNSFLFYISFEMVLIPTLFLITKLGAQPERLQAGIYLMVYTIVASLPLLIGLLFIKSSNFMFLIMSCYKIKFSMIFMLAFLVKMPMFLTHLWLPKAHVEAPLEGSMILAAVLLKLGGYGLLRFVPLIMFNLNKIPYWLLSISMFGAISTSMNCTRQKDLKSLIAYSSVAHMALVLSSIFTLNLMATNGAIIMMIAHGLSSSALFFLVNLIYTKFHTRNIISFKGLISVFPNISFWWFIFTAVNISAPPTINLVSEILMMMGLISWNYMIMAPLSLISIMTTSFSIILFSSLIHNKSEMSLAQNIPSKSFLALSSHFFPTILLITKMEMMMI